MQHATTRRGFVAALGFGGVSLYGLWAAYGAAPGPLAIFGRADPDASTDATPDAATEGGSGGHAGHGAVSGSSTSDDFRRRATAFVERFRMPDGSVYPRTLSPWPAPDAGHAGHAMPQVEHDGSPPAPAHASGQADRHAGSDSPDAAEPIEVYLLAEKWFYEPADLRLDTGVPYRFRMMAADVSHGASIQFGEGGRMIRLRPNVVTEMAVSFTRPGRYLVYCTVYCGQAHDVMQARIVVA